MLRNDLINLMAEYDNDNVGIEIDGFFIDVEAVTKEESGIALRVDLENLKRVRPTRVEQ